MNLNFLKIKPSFPISSNLSEGFDPYVLSIEQGIKAMVPSGIFESKPQGSEPSFDENGFKKLSEMLPLFDWDLSDEEPHMLSLSFLLQAAYTHGSTRFIIDTLSRSLIPGTSLPVLGVMGLSFKFLLYPKENFFFGQLFINIENKKNFSLLKQNLPSLIKKIRWTISAVVHTRKVVFAKPFNLEEKRIILFDSISKMVEGEEELDSTLFSDTHKLLLKAIKEEQKNLFPPFLAFTDLKPQADIKQIFGEIGSLILLFDEEFAKKRELSYLHKILSYLYLFRKRISHLVISAPAERHLSCKVLQTTLHHVSGSEEILGIVLAINFLKEDEFLGAKEILKAILSLCFDAQIVENSYISDREGKEKVQVYYLEVRRKGGNFFTSEEIKQIKKELPERLKKEVDRNHFSFRIHHNEEELMRNILTLSKEISHPEATPQVVINFDKHLKEDISFTVVLVSIQNPSIATLLLQKQHPYIKISNHEVKSVGLLNNRYPKEAHVFCAVVNRQIFAMKEAPIDLYLARQTVMNYLKELLGNVGDYHRGMIVKQYEAYSQLKALFKEATEEESYLLEKFFYSLSPAYLQSTLPSKLVKQFFLMFLEIKNRKSLETHFSFLSRKIDSLFLIVLASSDFSFIDSIKELAYKLSTNVLELGCFYLLIEDRSFLGFLARSSNEELLTQFSSRLHNACQEEKTQACFKTHLMKESFPSKIPEGV